MGLRDRVNARKAANQNGHVATDSPGDRAKLNNSKPSKAGKAQKAGQAIKGAKDAIQEHTSGRTLFGNICLVLQFLLLPVMLVAIILNTVPYVEMAQELLPRIIPGKAILGILVFGAIQLLEVVLLFLLAGDRDKLIHTLMARFTGKKWRKLRISPDDKPSIKRIKLRNNRKPRMVLIGLMLAGAVTYLFDFGACLWHYPPLTGVENLRVFWVAPSWGDVDWGNVFKMNLTLFAFEFCVGVFVMLDFAKDTFGLKEVAHAPVE